MSNKKNNYNFTKVKLSLMGLHVILTSGMRNIANIAVISDVSIVKNNNDLILQVTGDMKEVSEGIFINVQGIYYKLSFNIVSSNVSRDILKSYTLCFEDRIDFSYEVFDYCRLRNKVKQVRLSSSGGAFLDWYNEGRKTEHVISSYDGIWISGNYIRVLPILPPSLELNISETLFDIFNDLKLFTSVGNYEVFAHTKGDNLCGNYFEKYLTVNEIVIPSIKSFTSITNDKIIATDIYDKEFIVYANKKVSLENIA